MYKAQNINMFKTVGVAAVIIVLLMTCSNSPPTLKKAYKNIFIIGTSVNTEQINKGDQKAHEILTWEFGAITAENCMKWEKIHPEPGKYDFKQADKFVNLAEENDMYVVGHVLIWHSQTPGWVFYNEDSSKVSRDVLIQRMKEHIHTVVGRYKGRVDCWDVVNEAVDDNGNLRDNIWAQIIGKDYVQLAFKFAREADPDAELIYNDFSMPSPVKRDGVIRLIKEIQGNGVKVDGIGLQAHYHLDYPDLRQLEKSIVKFSELGVKVMITELDINILPFPDELLGEADVRIDMEKRAGYDPYTKELPDSMQQALTNRYVDFFKLFIKHKDKISRVTVWGIHDAQSWLNYWPIDDRTNYPLLFDRNYQAKPAYEAIISLSRQ